MHVYTYVCTCGNETVNSCMPGVWGQKIDRVACLNRSSSCVPWQGRISLRPAGSRFVPAGFVGSWFHPIQAQHSMHSNQDRGRRVQNFCAFFRTDESPILICHMRIILASAAIHSRRHCGLETSQIVVHKRPHP